ncbi:MAG: flavoprotein [Polyangiales bacterium]
MSEETTWERSPSVRAFSVRDRTVLVAADGKVVELAEGSAWLVRALLDALETPHATSELRARIVELTGEELARPAVIDETLALLLDVGAIRKKRNQVLAPVPGRIVVGVCGAVAAFESPRLALALLARGHEVRIALTRRARRFVQPEVLAAVTRAKVATRMHQRGRVPHVELAEWADLVLVAPATATTLSRIAQGDCSDLVSAIATTTSANVAIAPALTPGMAASPAVVRNLELLREDGRLVVHGAPAVEVAHAPQKRVARAGGMPSVDALVAIVDAILRTRGAFGPSTWDALHARAERPWELPLETELVDAIDAHVREGTRVLDLGTGGGDVALAVARRGARVVATDVSEHALARAREADRDASVTWLRDDVTASSLRTRFDVVIDRGCLHALPAHARAAWAKTVRATTHAGSLVLVVAHGPGTKALGVVPVVAESVLGDDFALESDRTCGQGPAHLMVFRRR